MDTVTQGSDDPLGKETPRSSRVSVFSNSEFDEASTPCGGDGSSEVSFSWPQV